MKPDSSNTYDAPSLPGTEQLTVFSGSEKHAEIDWENVNCSVQAVLEGFAEEVRQRWTHIRPRPGRTLTHLLLFSYCAFEVPSSPKIDPVIAGIDFRRAGEGRRILVQADLSSEESGQVFVELPACEVSEDLDEIRGAGEKLARQLSNYVDTVHDALHRQDPTACP